MDRVEDYLENKYLGLSTVGTVSAATFVMMDMHSFGAAALTAMFMAAYWSIYGRQ